MPVSPDYGKYASGEYLDYQKKYANQIRESDRKLIELVRTALADHLAAGMRPNLVDIGCSSGNLLLHLKHQIPELLLAGGDAFAPILDHCRANTDLAGITFEVMDLLNLGQHQRWDVVVVNAVLFLFNRDEFKRAIAHIAAALRPGGWLAAFDFAVPYQQELAIHEKSKTHPDGLTLYFRPATLVREVLQEHGFERISIEPFDIPIDLPESPDLQDISSRTVVTLERRRLIFRGALYTPWCHLTARKCTA